MKKLITICVVAGLIEHRKMKVKERVMMMFCILLLLLAILLSGVLPVLIMMLLPYMLE